MIKHCTHLYLIYIGIKNQWECGHCGEPVKGQIGK